MDRKKHLNQDLLTTYDSLIIGGGIVGAGVFRDQALNGLEVLLVDQGDFSSQTSQGSSKMLHGGIRYLENMDFALVFEALKEKNLWLRLTPHISKEIPFILPVYKESKWPMFFMRIGLFLYDLLSLFKNSPHKTLSKKKVLNCIPNIKQEGLRGAGLYYDGIVDDSKLALECIYDGVTFKNCHAHNYKKVTKIENIDNTHRVTLQDQITNEVYTINAKNIIFATGPFTDQVMKKLDIPWEPVILPSKGTHLWLKQNAIPMKEAMVLQTKDGRIIFVIPQRHSILVGTTETPLPEDFDFFNIKPTQEEIDYLLNSVREYFPNIELNHDDIISSFAAVRPLVKANTSSKKTSRNHKIYTPQKGMYVLVGGKYTTFRRMAEDLNKKIFKDLARPYNKKLSLRPLKEASIVKDPYESKISQQEIEKIIREEGVRTMEDLVERRLSIQSLRHFSDQELSSMIESYKNRF